ncbi:MAG: GAF domain-containing protein [Bacteroidota bacterium]|nr:GAF domain-containing protein [Bacteroidota bacterium]
MNKNLIQYIRKHLITISICFILILVIINTIVSFLQVRTAEQNNKLNKEIADIKHRLNLVNTHVNLADMAFRGFVVIEDDVFLNPFNEQVMMDYQKNYDSLSLMLGNHGFDTSIIPPVKEKVGSYMELINTMIHMRRQNKLEEIIDILKSDPGYDIWKVYAAFVNEASAFEERLAESSLREYERISLISSVFQILLCVLGFPTLIFTMIIIIKNNNVKKQLFDSIDQSNRKYIFDPHLNHTFHDEKLIIKSLIQNLKKISDFIKGITSGNYTIDWEGLNDNNKDANKENIVADLINMREQMKVVKEQDEKRLWATEGVSKFGEIVRLHQNDINQLCYEVISNIVKYVKANQGGILILKDTEPNDRYLELVACYAFSRKKFIQKRIEPDQGLVGQAYLEEDIIYMTDIPDDYISIRSGLGDANPTCLLIIPLKYNNKVEAVIEMASFSKFTPHEIELVQKIGEYVASAIASVKVNVKTRELLENTQQQAEHMMTQEEEMRQNMEELQATQEEVQRRTLEYQQIIESNNEELTKLREKVRHLENQPI